ncbi:MAG: TatD family hydrolase [Clostridia bacterium]|nr:TatD family hydrolase [Clostridia bacterium]
MLIDTHSHINHEKLAEKLDEILEGLKTDRVGAVVCPSFSYESSKTSLEVAKNSRVWCALGVHPECATEYDDETEKFLLSSLNNERVVAVGEIGLDYHYGTEHKDRQKEVLIEQMKLANQFDLPVIFHVRDAWDDFFEIYEQNRHLVKRGVIHCFEGDSEIAKRALDLGLWISLTGLVTFKQRNELREAVKLIPLDRFMVETDAPYLTPEPFRREINEPKFTALVADKIAELKGLSAEEIDEITTTNTLKFFDKMRLE